MEILKGFEFQLQRFADQIKLEWGASADGTTVKAVAATAIDLSQVSDTTSTWYLYTDAALSGTVTSITPTVAASATVEAQRIGTISKDASGNYTISLTGLGSATAVKFSKLQRSVTTATLTLSGTNTYTGIGTGTGLVLKVDAADTDDKEIVSSATDLTLEDVSATVSFDFANEVKDIKFANTALSAAQVSITGKGAINKQTGVVTDYTSGAIFKGLPSGVDVTNGTTSLAKDGTVTVNGKLYVASATHATGFTITTTTVDDKLSSKLKAGTALIDVSSANGDNSSVTVNSGKEVSVAAGSAVVNGADGKVTSMAANTNLTTGVYDTGSDAANVLMGAKLATGETLTINKQVFHGYTGGVNNTFVVRSESQVAVAAGTYTLDSTASSILLAGGVAGGTATKDVKVEYSGSSGDGVQITAAGVITDLEAGESVTVTYDGGGATTYSVADDVLTAVHTVSGVTTSKKYTLSTSGGSCGVSALLASTKDVTDKTQLSGVVDYQVPAKYSQLSSNGTATLAVLENEGTQVFNNTGTSLGTDIYATLARKTDGTYTLTTNATASALTGLKVDFSALGSSTVAVTNSNKNFADGTVYQTANGAFTTAVTSFSVKGNEVSGFGTGTNGLTVTSGTLTLGDTGGVNVTTSIGTLTITDATTTATKVTSAGTVTGLDNAGTVALVADKTQEDGQTTVLSINGKSFTAVTNKGATIEYTSVGNKWELTAGSLAVDAGASQAFNNGSTDTAATTGTVKVTGGNGIVLNSDGTFSGLENGETVTVTPSTGTKKYVYTARNGIVQLDSYTDATTYTTKYYKMTGDSISTSAVDTLTNGEYTTVDGISITGNTGGAVAVTSLDADGTTLYVNKAGETSLTEPSNAVATITRSNDVVTYTAASTAKGQTVTVASDANGYNNAVNWSITTTNSADTVDYGASSDATISTGAGKDTVTVSSAGEVSLNTGDGNDYIQLTGAGTYNVTTGAGKNTVSASGAGEYVITAGEGGNLIDRSGGTDGNATITGGTGKDTITAAGLNDDVTGGDGADTFNVSQKSMTIKDYVYGTDVLRATTNTTAPAVTVANYNGDGTVVIASGTSTVDVSAGTGTGDFYAVSLVDSNGKNRKNVAWAKDGGSTIDISTYDQAVTLIGNADGANALYAGTKADNIYSYADNDSVYGGEGKDYISLASGAAGRVVGVATTGGKDTVDGFKASFEEGDSIFMIDGSASVVKASFANNTVTFKDGDGSLQLNGVTASSTTGAVELNVSGTKVALAAASVGGAIAADSTSYADVYMGKNAALSFATAEGEVNVDLRNGLDSGAAGAKYSGITSLTGGAGNNTLIGAAGAESIHAGTGASSLWGGAGKDTLVGGSASDVFYIGTGDGSDVVTNFSAAGNENADTVYTFSNITGAKLTNNGVEISVSDTDKITLQNVAADTAIKFNAGGNAGVAKVGSATNANNFTYDSTVTYYGGGNKSDKIAFASGSTEDAQVWLDGSQGKSYASIDVVDGTNAGGSLIVAGDSASQSIIGGKGDTSLWGGAGSATDTLKSSSTGKTMFWWGAGDGNDVVVSASADDSVNLYNVKLSDINSANSSITNSGVVLALNDGSKLTMQTNRNMTFSIEGQSWTADQSSKEWKQNS